MRVEADGMMLPGFYFTEIYSYLPADFDDESFVVLIQNKKWINLFGQSIFKNFSYI